MLCLLVGARKSCPTSLTFFNILLEFLMMKLKSLSTLSQLEDISQAMVIQYAVHTTLFFSVKKNV